MQPAGTVKFIARAPEVEAVLYELDLNRFPVIRSEHPAWWHKLVMQHRNDNSYPGQGIRLHTPANEVVFLMPGQFVLRRPDGVMLSLTREVFRYIYRADPRQ